MLNGAASVISSSDTVEGGGGVHSLGGGAFNKRGRLFKALRYASA